MNPLTLATLFFSRLLQCRIMSPGRQCLVPWYTSTCFRRNCCFSHQGCEM